MGERVARARAVVDVVEAASSFPLARYADVVLFAREGDTTPCAVELQVDGRVVRVRVRVTDAEADPAAPGWPEAFAHVARARARRRLSVAR